LANFQKQSNKLKTLTFTQNVFSNPLATFCRFEIVTKINIKNDINKKKAKINEIKMNRLHFDRYTDKFPFFLYFTLPALLVRS